MSDADAAGLLGLPPFARQTAKSQTRLAPLLADLKLARRNGYAVSDEENLVGVYAIGAVVRDASGATAAALSGALSLIRATSPCLRWGSH